MIVSDASAASYFSIIVDGERERRPEAATAYDSERRALAERTVRADGARQSLVVTAEFGALVWGSRAWDFNAMHVDPPQGETEDERREREAAQEATMHNHKRGIKSAVSKLAATTKCRRLSSLRASARVVAQTRL